jgi:hypothetical protein
MFRRLDPEHLIETSRRLASRVKERFPQSGLAQVTDELIDVARRAAADREYFATPHAGLRILVGICITLLLVVAVGSIVVVLRFPANAGITDVIQAIDAGVNDLVFLGIAIYFLASLEVRRKRNRALKAIHELRSMAHIIDMHQLTKDPERVRMGDDGENTPSSPTRELSVFQLSRYLDYCSEALSLLSKFAALYVQDFDDPVTISAVNEVENLTNGLSRKIWQKIMILDREAG